MHPLNEIDSLPFQLRLRPLPHSVLVLVVPRLERLECLNVRYLVQRRAERLDNVAAQGLDILLKMTQVKIGQKERMAIIILPV